MCIWGSSYHSTAYHSKCSQWAFDLQLSRTCCKWNSCTWWQAAWFQTRGKKKKIERRIQKASVANSSMEPEVEFMLGVVPQLQLWGRYGFATASGFLRPRSPWKWMLNCWKLHACWLWMIWRPGRTRKGGGCSHVFQITTASKTVLCANVSVSWPNDLHFSLSLPITSQLGLSPEHGWGTHHKAFFSPPSPFLGSRVLFVQAHARESSCKSSSAPHSFFSFLFLFMIGLTGWIESNTDANDVLK